MKHLLAFAMAALVLVACHSRNPGFGTPRDPGPLPDPKPPRDFCAKLPEADRAQCYIDYPNGQPLPPTQN